MQPSGTFNETYAQDMAIVRTRLQWILMAALFLLLLAFPHFTSRYWVSLVNSIAIIVVGVLGLNIVTGLCGQMSLGQAGFMAMGAYASGVLTVDLGWPFWFALPAAGLVAGLAGLVVGIPALKVKGFYLVVATIAFQFIVGWVIFKVPALTRGATGFNVPAPTIGDFAFQTPQSYYYVIIVVTILAVLGTVNIARTRWGRAFVAVRDNDLAAEVMGVNVFGAKLMAFFLAAVYGGIAGSLLAHSLRYIQPEYFTFTDSIWFLAMLIVGGLGSTVGTIFGVAIIKLLMEVSVLLPPVLIPIFPFIPSDVGPGIGLALTGIIVVLVLIYEPRGLAHRWQIFKASYRVWPFSH